MALRLFNTLTRSIEEFVPLDPTGQSVCMYCCGPTVYDFGHIGNFRTFVFSDLVRRYLEFKGYAVTHVMNITDVEDKILKRIREAAVSLREYTGKYEQAFLEDMQTLGCLRPHQLPRATEHIPDMIALIARLLERGVAYKTADGSVYFGIEKYVESGGCYGQLVKLNFDQMRRGERVSSDEYEKESLADFALWKARAPEDGEVFWPSPWGDGRPGWHIECSAMSMKLLGPSFDLHLGGEDLMFPHHEDEIAQSEGAAAQVPGRRFVKYWMHAAHLLVDNKKMAKSLGNFYTLRDLLKRGFGGREIRLLMLAAHYRESFNFTLDGLQGAQASLARLDDCLGRLREIAGTTVAEPDTQLLTRFAGALDEDLNVAAAWGIIFDWVRELNRVLAAQQITPLQAASALSAWQRIDSVFGLGWKETDEAPPDILALLDQRQAARKAKDFPRADALRDELGANGWGIEDTPQGPRLKRL